VDEIKTTRKQDSLEARKSTLGEKEERALEAYVQALGKQRTSAEDFHGMLHDMNCTRPQWVH
jgi:hypothetical protein